MAGAAAVTCHCFRDREYDAANPAASDAYLLATASNTLLAAVAGIPKREIVEARMSGTAGEDLWIAAHVARRRGMGVREVLEARARAASWREFLEKRGASPDALGRRFDAALAAGAPDVTLARIAASEALAERVGTAWAQLDTLAAAGAGYQETIVAALIGRWGGKDPLGVLETARAGVGWSGQLAALGKFPRAMETEIPALLAPAAGPGSGAAATPRR
ncbi:MAG TPA: hypothetical protein VI078_05140 [bacterium]